MIDTAVVRLHGVRKHQNLLKSLRRPGTKGYTVKEGRVDPKKVQELRKMGVTDTTEIIRLLQINNQDKFIVKTQVAKHVNRSNHYELTYFVNQTKDYIEFNFSVPKYAYGSNVLLFVDHILDRAYSFHECCELQHNFDRAYDRLRSFLREFFRLEFINIEIDPRDVEINRIDALKYLEYQKRKPKRHSHDEN
jgi:hypothetical protein